MRSICEAHPRVEVCLCLRLANVGSWPSAKVRTIVKSGLVDLHVRGAMRVLQIPFHQSNHRLLQSCFSDLQAEYSWAFRNISCQVGDLSSARVLSLGSVSQKLSFIVCLHLVEDYKRKWFFKQHIKTAQAAQLSLPNFVPHHRCLSHLSHQNHFYPN